MSKTYIITGPYGSGKTEFCVNLAKSIAKEKKTVLADLDTINLSFRSREKAEELTKLGVEVIGGHLDNNVAQDVPAVSYSFLSAINQDKNLIMDLGGGKQGVKLLSHCYDYLKDGQYEFLCVLNMFRPDAATPQKMVEFVRSINGSTKIKVTGLVANGHMIHHTELEHVKENREAVIKACELLKIPHYMTFMKKDFHEQLKNELNFDEQLLIFDNLEMRKKWQ
ncbi:MAG: ATP-binding protein [Defluviitaleaceae bacterium]|nr:ATP-binding protein [Defluviitaleaceae bacterium]